MTKKFEENFGFYAVLTNPVIGYEKMTAILVVHKVAFVQLRMKDAPREKVLQVAQNMRKITANSNTFFIVNDDVNLALEVGADGVHVGQDDMPYDEVRKLVGDDMIVGVSTHNIFQARKACNAYPPPDYIGVGPVFKTPTKKIADPTIGINGMRDMLAIAQTSKNGNVPAVCIGGIDPLNLREVVAAGAKNFCMVRALMKCGDEAAVNDFFKFVGKYC